MPRQAALESSVRYFKGIGPKRAERLKRLGVETVRDLLHYYPRGWEDRRLGMEAQPRNGSVVFFGKVVKTRLIRAGMRLAIFKAQLRSGDSNVEAVWFKRPSLRYDVFAKVKAEVAPGEDIWVVGRSEPTLLQAREVQVEEYYRASDRAKTAVHVDRIVPVYALTEGVQSGFLREIVFRALQLAAERAEEVLPREILARRQLLAAPQALRGIHFPGSFPELEEARRRLAYEELLFLGLAWIIKRRQTKEVHKSHAYEVKRHLLTPFRSQLGFELTRAQKRVINEILESMQAPWPMTRLLQGDVGSGKTVVAIAALLLAVENGFQAAFMAPTEILAEQHFTTMTRFLKGLPVKLALLTSRTTARDREVILGAIRQGGIDIAIGTHALLEGDVHFPRLKMAVVDEQHRFGVRQRTSLRQKGPPVDLLMMTATPIPRTLALSLYGDLDVSTLDEMPPGRVPVPARHASEEEAFAAIRSEVGQGHQAYIVYPIIEESSQLDLKSAKAEYERIKNQVFPDLRVALIHGQMPGKRKTQVMEDFLKRRWDVLVATPVVEVGIDVPNATVMMVQNADRFGLASLHQLRGRIGRGDAPSRCFLVAGPKTPEAQSRIRTLCHTQDGFVIAEEDLKLRGPGEVLGTAQHGELSLRVADLLKDADLLAQARQDAESILAADGYLTRTEHQGIRERLIALYQYRWHSIDLA